MMEAQLNVKFPSPIYDLLRCEKRILNSDATKINH